MIQGSKNLISLQVKFKIFWKFLVKKKKKLPKNVYVFRWKRFFPTGSCSSGCHWILQGRCSCAPCNLGLDRRPNDSLCLACCPLDLYSLSGSTSTLVPRPFGLEVLQVGLGLNAQRGPHRWDGLVARVVNGLVVPGGGLGIVQSSLFSLECLLFFVRKLFWEERNWASQLFLLSKKKNAVKWSKKNYQ